MSLNYLDFSLDAQEIPNQDHTVKVHVLGAQKVSCLSLVRTLLLKEKVLPVTFSYCF